MTTARGQVGEAFKKVDPELEAEAAKWLTPKEIKDGGALRSDESKQVYWLNLRQLIEFQKHDNPDVSDADFWAWFEDFRDTEGLSLRRKRVSWTDSMKEYAGNAWTQTKNYMSKWWDDAGYSSAGSEQTRKLAVALGAVTTTVSVINDSGKRYRVELAAEDSAGNPTNFTNFEEGRVVISPQALLDKSLSKEDGIEITNGYGLHEASHIQYTEPIVDALTNPTEITPLVVSQRLFNILEDMRIESLTGEKFPGFKPYFEKMLRYLWKNSKDAVPKEWGPDIGAKLNAILATLRWPDEFEPIARNDPRLSEEFDWFRGWAERYLEERITARQALVEAFAHLREDAETEKQLGEIESQEKGSIGGKSKQLTDKQFKDLMKDLERHLLGDKKVETCPSPHAERAEIKLRPEQAHEIGQLISQQLKIDDPVVKMKDMYGVERGPSIISLKPELTPEVRDAYRKPSDLVARMKGAFFFRKAAPQWSDRLLKSGNVDEDELWRFGAGDFRIFEQKKTADTPDTQVTLLVDMSGSMNGERIASAYELGNVMLECLRTMKGVRVRVRGHTTGDESAGGECLIYKLWDQGDPMERLGLIDTLAHRWNYDGFAVGWCAEELIADQRPHEDMVLIVLSDGKPNARGFPYSGVPAMDHVNEVVSHYERDGVTIIQIAIDPEMRVHDQARMYKHWIPFQNRAQLPAQLTKTLIKLFGGA